MFYTPLLVKVAGLLVILLAMAALIAGSVLAWWAATAIGENFQVDFCLGYCLFSLPRLEVIYFRCEATVSAQWAQLQPILKALLKIILPSPTRLSLLWTD